MQDNSIRKILREQHRLDIVINPQFAKEGVDKKNLKNTTHTGMKERHYTYAIIESDGDKYRYVDSGHKPWPILPTYETAEADAIGVCMAYINTKNKA